MIHEGKENVATAGTSSLSQCELAKRHKRKVDVLVQAEVGEGKIGVGDEDSESGVSDLEGLLMKTRKRRKSLPLSPRRSLSSLSMLVHSHGFPVLREEDIRSTVTSLGVEDMELQVGAGLNNIIGDAGGVDMMDCSTTDDEEEDEDDRYRTVMRSISTTVVEIDDEEDDEEVISPSQYVLSSGRVTQTRQPQMPPTIDDEFEQYFKQLML